MFEIRELRQIQALASPARQAIVDALETMGPCSALELGQVLGRSSDRLYYHLQILKRSRLVRSRRERNALGRMQECFDLPGRPTRLRYDPSDPRNVAAVTKVVGSALRDAHRAFRKSFRKGVAVRGSSRALWAGRRTGWLGAKEVRAINLLLERAVRVMERSRRGRRGTQLYALTFSFSPYGVGAAPTNDRGRSRRGSSRQ